MRPKSESILLSALAVDWKRRMWGVQSPPPNSPVLTPGARGCFQARMIDSMRQLFVLIGPCKGRIFRAEQASAGSPAESGGLNSEHHYITKSTMGIEGERRERKTEGAHRAYENSVIWSNLWIFLLFRTVAPSLPTLSSPKLHGIYFPTWTFILSYYRCNM